MPHPTTNIRSYAHTIHEYCGAMSSAACPVKMLSEGGHHSQLEIGTMIIFFHFVCVVVVAKYLGKNIAIFKHAEY